ncbi:endonuclease domain-containing protein [Acidaminococcus fermentans]|uniref:Endonuclease domain-containing protein n=2 Tax=Acidaminococcaceae TaxID=909930 RepID=A0A6N7VMK7_ACIFE|nr:endonuclease domain-containing protein [Acidaminococcus fermentans]
MRKNMTKEERHLWFDFFRKYPVRVKRQVIIGKYIVDFCCERAQVIIELDGGQHYETENKKADAERTRHLERLGFLVLRYSNRDVMRNFSGVTENIDRIIRERMKKLGTI